MLKLIYTAAVGALFFASFISDAQAKTSRAISTDDKSKLQAVVGVRNADVMAMFIFANPNGSNDYILAGSDRIFCSKSFVISAGESCTASSPGSIVQLDSKTGADGEWPIGSPLVFDPQGAPSPRANFGQVELALTNFDASQTYLSGGSSVPDESGLKAFGRGSGSVQMDMVAKDFEAFGLGVLDPSIAASLSVLSNANRLQFIGWQDSNVSVGSNFDPHKKNSVDPWTYDNMILAVWFVPKAKVPEPASLLLFAPVLFGVSYIARRRSGLASH